MLTDPSKLSGLSKKQVLVSRRRYKRVDSRDCWVFWRCGRIEDTSHVADLGPGGLFVVTSKVCAPEATVDLHFLVEDGEVRATATVRHVKAGAGIGLQFRTIRNEDQTRFSTMIKRLIQLAECPL